MTKTTSGVKAVFRTNGIQDVLDDIGATHFNWIQICVKDDHPPLDSGGKAVTVPYIDPYPGGYALESKPGFYYWNDGLCYYWDMKNVITKGIGCYDISCTLHNNITCTELLFQDTPYIKPNSEIKFKTWLVAVDSDLRLSYVFAGFKWGVKKDANDTVVDLSVVL